MEQLKSQNQERLGTAPVFPLIISMSLPSMFSMLVQALYNIVDSIFVAQINETALSAVSLVYPIQLLAIAVSVGTGVGLSSLISRRLGEKRFEDAQNAADHGFFLSILHWLVFLLFGFFGVRPFCEAFSENSSLVEPAVAYGSIVCIGSLFSLCTVAFEKIMQAGGNMLDPMWSMLLGAVLNIILDPIMIFGYFGLPALGVSGAAYATVIGQIASCALSAVFLKVRKLPATVTFRPFRLQGRIIKDIYQVGLPSMVMQAIGSLTTICLNAILIGLEEIGETAVAVLGVYFKLQTFVFMPVFGMNHGLMPIMGYNFGAKNRKRVIQAHRYGTVIALVIMVIGTLIFQAFPELLMSMFSAKDQMMSIGCDAMRIISLCFPFAAVSIIMGTLFQATGHGGYSLIVSLLRQIIVIIPAAYVLSKFMGAEGVWLSYPIAECFSLVCSSVLCLYLYRKEINRLS